MDDSIEVRCCGREMTRIAVQRPSERLDLHSCPSCGQHAWRSGGRPVDRAQLLAALRVERVAAPVPERRPDRLRQGEDTRRTELQRLLNDFTVHGPAA